MSTQTKGIDISKFQGHEINDINTSNTDLNFVICKATGGITYTDPDFSTNWNAITKQGFVKGAYHFYYTNDAPQPQSNNFITALGDNFPSDAFPPIVDFEETSIKTQDKNQIVSDLLTFLGILEEKYGRVPMIYTDVNVGNEYLNDPRFKKYPLWIANYTTKSAPTMPGAWTGTEWVLWQQSDNYKIGDTANDYDLFNGDLQQLKDFIANH
ncbi:GH25 family lysozyme [Kordia sp.]|uniref:GH25 family lysozyme n=1 Tax=Kordia sp. TaxID=1965332 RepID=UPI003D2BB35D